jgi:hypothetical protein
MGLRSIYIDTEHTFSSIRLLNMINDVMNDQQEHLLELVRTETISDFESLMSFLQLIDNEFEDQQREHSTDQWPILLVIDSIAAPLRMSITHLTREHSLLLFTDSVKRLATRYNLLVLG